MSIDPTLVVLFVALGSVFTTVGGVAIVTINLRNTLATIKASKDAADLAAKLAKEEADRVAKVAKDEADKVAKEAALQLSALNAKTASIVTQTEAIGEKTEQVHVMVNSRFDQMATQVQQARDDLHTAMQTITQLQADKVIMTDRAAGIAAASAASLSPAIASGDIAAAAALAASVVATAAATAAASVVATAAALAPVAPAVAADPAPMVATAGAADLPTGLPTLTLEEPTVVIPHVAAEAPPAADGPLAPPPVS